MLSRIKEEIESSIAVINRKIRDNRDNFPSNIIEGDESFMGDEVTFNGFSSVSLYKNKLSEISNQFDIDLIKELQKHPKTKRLKFLKLLLSEIVELEDLFHFEKRNLYTTYLRKELKINNLTKEDNYRGNIEVERISSFLHSQLTSVKWLKTITEDQIENTKDLLMIPETRLDSRVLVLIIYFLDRNAIIHLNKIHQDNTKKALLLSALFTRNKDKIRKYLGLITKKSTLLDMLNVNDLDRIKRLFQECGMIDIVNDVQSEIDKLNIVT
jgi:hypothetical protein